MRRKFIFMILAIFMVAFYIFKPTQFASANSDINSKIGKLEKEEKKLKLERENLNKDQKDLDEKLNKNVEEQKQVEQEIYKIDLDLIETQSKLYNKETEIEETNSEISKLTDEIEELEQDILIIEDRIEKREELLKNRLLSIQKSGGNTRFIEVIFGSKSFTDFISRSIAMNTIMDQDKSIMDEQIADKQLLEEKQNKIEEQKSIVEEKKKELEKQKDDLITLKSNLDKQLKNKENLQKKLQTEYDQIELHMMTLEEEQNILKEQEKIIKQEKEKLKQLSQVNSNLHGGGSGILNWPTSGRISSPYGQRSFNGGSFHYGLDIAAPRGTPVTAAASGVVTRASYSPSYGNVVFIHHPQLNKSTVYAHMHSISVRPGQHVNVGELVGTVGNTGNSFGNHLHFEVHNGLWSAKGGINPIQFLK